MHMYPELSFAEHKTAKFVGEQLEKAGIPFQPGYAGTGILAEVEGKAPGKVIALRAERRIKRKGHLASPVLEETVIRLAGVGL